VSTPPESTLPFQPIQQNSNSESNPGGSQSVSAPDPDNPPWSLLQALLIWVASVLLLLVPQVCALVYVVYHYKGIVPPKEVLFADKTFFVILVLVLAPVHVLTLGLIWAVATLRGKISAKKALGWSWPTNFGVVKSVALAILLFMIAMFVSYRFGGQETDIERLLQSSRAAALITAVLAATTAPLVEETIYRGLLYSAFQRAIGPVFAVIVVASMFAGLHVVQYWPNVGAISAITFLSVALTVVRARTGRLLPCFVIHLVYNGIQSLIIIFEPHLRALYHSWHPEAAAPGLISFLLGLTR
jgi:membrane protease YdiL (CAAX protease family)